MAFWSLVEHVFGWGGVIAYHGVGDSPHSPVMHVSPRRLRAQLELLRDRYHVVQLRELVRRWAVRESTRNLVAITFDDAYAGVLIHALPILRELSLPATVFVTSNHAAIGASYWWDDVERRKTGADERAWNITLREVGLTEGDANQPDIVERIRSRVLARFSGRWPGGLSPAGRTLWRSLEFDELARLAADERIDFGVHTLSHPALPLLSYDEQVREIRDSFVRLKELLPRVLSVVAYPYGLYDEATIRAARAAGMVAGLTMEGRASADHPNPMIVPRVGAGDIHPPSSLALRLNRALRPALVVRNRGRHPRMPVEIPAIRGGSTR